MNMMLVGYEMRYGTERTIGTELVEDDWWRGGSKRKEKELTYLYTIYSHIYNIIVKEINCMNFAQNHDND